METDKLEPEAQSKPTWYHVVFFDTPQVKRAWVRVEELVRFEKIDEPPKGSSVIKASLKGKWKKILSMASECAKLSREQRLEQFSFAALYDGKWGYYDENTKLHGKKKVPQEQAPTVESSAPVQKEWKPSDLLNLWNNNTGSEKITVDEWTCNMCQKRYPYVENIIVKHLKFHHMNVEVRCQFIMDFGKSFNHLMFRITLKSTISTMETRLD